MKHRSFMLCAALLFSLRLFGQSIAADVDWVRVSKEKQAIWEMRSEPSTLILRHKDATADARKVFILFPKKSTAYNTALDTILQVFEERGLAVEIVACYYEDKDALGQIALARAEAQHASLIFAMGSQAAGFLNRVYQGGSVPVVTVCAKDPVLLGYVKDYDSGSGNNFAYTSLNVPVDLQMQYLTELRPGLSSIIVLYERTNTSTVETQVKPLKALASTRNMRCVDLAIENDKRTGEELAQKMPAIVALEKARDPSLQNTIIWITGSSSLFTQMAAINTYADRIPVMSAVPDVVRTGDESAVMSIGVGFESNAHVAAVYASMVLSGERKVGELPVGVVSPPDIAVNFRKARQAGIKIPFAFFESASYIYDGDGAMVREAGRNTTN